MATATVQLNITARVQVTPAFREVGLDLAEILSRNALEMILDPTVPISEVVANVDAAADVYAEMAR
jgi:hypothetical protein